MIGTLPGNATPAKEGRRGIDHAHSIDGEVWQIIFCNPEIFGPTPDFDKRGYGTRLKYWVLCRVLGLLKSGFRHCFLVREPQHAGEGWLVLNPHSMRIDITQTAWHEIDEMTRSDAGSHPPVHWSGCGGYGADLLAAQHAGHLVRLRLRIGDIGRLRLWRTGSCVAVCARVLALDPPFWICTPWQYYRWLLRRHRDRIAGM